MVESKLFSFILVGVIAWAQLCSVAGQQLPPVPCPHYFKYQHDGFGYFGIITLPQWPIGKADVRVHTSQSGLPNSNYHGRITAYPNDQTVIRNILEGKGATFRLYFADPGNPPKLTLLAQDDVTLCEGTDYPPPNSVAQFSYTISTYYLDTNGYKLKSTEVTHKPSKSYQGETTVTSIDTSVRRY